MCFSSLFGVLSSQAIFLKEELKCFLQSNRLFLPPCLIRACFNVRRDAVTFTARPDAPGRSSRSSAVVGPLRFLGTLNAWNSPPSGTSAGALALKKRVDLNVSFALRMKRGLLDRCSAVGKVALLLCCCWNECRATGTEDVCALKLDCSWNSCCSSNVPCENGFALLTGAPL